MALTRLRCESCGAELSEHNRATTCPTCGGLLSLENDLPAATAEALRELFADRLSSSRAAASSEIHRSGVWRFRELVLPAMPDADVVTQWEGNTPLLKREGVSEWTGVSELHLKHEGHNPTGSFKDRGMTVAVSNARRIGATAVSCASTGNTSASLAAYAALAGIPAIVFVPAGQIALGKLAQTLAYGARTLMVRGDFDDCLRLAKEASEKLGVYLVNSINPFRIAGQTTIVLDLLQQLAWNAPDWIVVPAGNLGNTAAFGAAIRVARATGLIDSAPRLAAVQAQGAAPFAKSFREGFTKRETVRAETVATAIKIGDPASYDRGVRAIRETNGVVLDVSDAEILDAKAIIDASGVGCEPASAASVAGVRRLVSDGVIRKKDRVVAILTGHILKDPGILIDYHRDASHAQANPPIEIDARLDAVEGVMKSSGNQQR
ncbi:MAG TPA: threonine synthase [Gemmatimonadaceae bacterium]|nr:threonine synthase [Gemmatimonadaceae bacterium]